MSFDPYKNMPWVSKVRDAAIELLHKKGRIRRRDIIRHLMGHKDFISKEENKKNRRTWIRNIATNVLNELEVQNVCSSHIEVPKIKPKTGTGRVKYWTIRGRQAVAS
jgi:hypothetical protein